MKKVLLGSVSALALVVMMGGVAKADSNIDILGNGSNIVDANQTVGGEVTGSNSSVDNATAGNISNRTGQVVYGAAAFSAPGVYTLQNQTGMNNAGGQGTNVAAQLNGDPASSPAYNVELDTSAENRVEADQTMNATVWNSNSTVDNNTLLTGNVTNQTGDIAYGAPTFVQPGLYTLQNQTGMNNAGTNGLNLAVQVNEGGTPYNVVVGDEVTNDGTDSINSVKADQAGTALVSGSDSDVDNDVGLLGSPSVTNRTGDVNYGAATFAAPGVYTLQNQTGMNNAGSQGTNVAAQLNDNGDSVFVAGNGLNQVVATQDLAATVSGSDANVESSTDILSAGPVVNRTGDVNYAAGTFVAPGLYTLQNQTGMNVAGSNGMNLAVQTNGF